MTRPWHTLKHLALPVLCALLCLRLQGDARTGDAGWPMAFAAAMPEIVLWAWEEPEDLRTAPATTAGVAYLAETLLLKTGLASAGSPATPVLTVVSRHQPLAVAPGARVMAVVRIIAPPGFRDSDSVREQTAGALAAVARQPGIAAFQVDFDATRSQHAFYAEVLRRLRPLLPAGMPLSITALVSWCGAAPGDDDWLAGLPIDEAVPMFFRLGGNTRPFDAKTGYPLREPLCRGSVGISTDESWPELRRGERIYLFAPRPWTAEQLASVDSVAEGRRPAALESPYRFEAVDDTGKHGPPNHQTQPSEPLP